MEKIIAVLFFVWLVVFPFGQLAQIPGLSRFGLPEIHFLFIDLLTFLLGIVWLVWRLLMAKKKYSWPVFSKPLAFFLIIAAISLLFNACHYKVSEIIVSSFYLGRLMAYFLLYFILIDLRKTIFTQDKLVGYLVVVGLASAAFGFIQYFLWPDITFLQGFGWDPHYYRLVGTFFDPGFIGMIILFTLFFLITLWPEKLKSFQMMNIPYYIAVAVTYLAMMLTYSRSTYLAFVCGVIVIAFLKKSLKFFLVVSAILLLTIILLPRSSGGEGVRLGRTVSTKARLGNWEISLGVAKINPLIGVGFNTYRYYQKNLGLLGDNLEFSHAGAGVDSSFLFVMLTTGVIGLGAYLWLWFSVFREVVFSKNILRSAVLPCLAGLIVHSFFQNSLFYPWVMGFWIFILALL